MITASRDEDVRVWDSKSGNLLHCFQGHWGSVSSIFAAEKTIISGGLDSTIRKWDLNGIFAVTHRYWTKSSCGVCTVSSKG